MCQSCIERKRNEIKEREELIQKVIDRLVGTDGNSFKNRLIALVDSYPDNERPLDNSVPNLISMNGDVTRNGEKIPFSVKK